MRAIRVYPLFFIVLALLMIIPVHAGTYVGYDSTNQGSSTCGSNCVGNANVATDAFGQTIQSPSSGQLLQVGVFTGSSIPNKIVILTYASAPTVSPWNCGSAGTCGFVSGSPSATVVDVESLPVLSGNAFATVTLANPLTVTSGQWIAIVFLAPASNNGYLMFAGTGGKSSVGDTLIHFGTINPSGSYTVSVTNSPSIVGGAFVPSGSSITVVTQCIGNCGSPAVTLVNTNSLTNGFNFNLSVTVFYEVQATLNGFLLNETVNIGQNYNNGQQVLLGIYTATCVSGTTPFTSQCPGQLQASSTSGVNVGKGKFSLVPTPISITSGQWIGLAFTSLYSPINVNDTNTAVPIFFTTFSRMPTIISTSQQASQASCTCKAGIYGYLVGNVVNQPPPTQTIVECGTDFICWELQSILGLTPKNPFLGAIFFAFAYSMFSTFVLAFVTMKTHVGFPGGVYLFVWVGWFTFFPSLVGAIFFVVVEILAVILMFTLFFSQLAQGTFKPSSGKQDA